MRPTYIALPHLLTSRGWMVFNRVRCRPVAESLTRPQAQTLATALNLASTGEQPILRT
jgi:hypothetical protein